ncbi:S9 family peptidase [Rhodohalobacter halophilus]|uniref:S9 family peptidase n=1 Tax=Rhodohalobacter halophilus TaxID=1812810 RepID=UPI00083F5AB8|nr:S9 family peptidase [Rhodohalobacter halophilus]
MKRIVLFLFFTLFVSSAFAQKRPMTTDDIINMDRLGSAMISPDGNAVIFGKSTLNWDDNKRETKYYYIPADSGAVYQYIGEAGGSDMKYSPDGKYISLKRSVDDKQQLFLLPTTGGEAVQLTEHKNSIGSYEWGTDSKAIYFVSSVPRSSDEEKEYKAGYDQLFVDEPPHGQTEGSWNNIWKFDIDSKEETKLTSGELIVGSFAVSPNQERIVYTARFENRRNQQYLSEIYLLEVGDSTAVQLTENEVPEGGLNWLPDNQHILYSAAHDEEWELHQSKLWRMHVDSKEYEMISGQFNGNIGSVHMSPDGETIYFSGSVKTNSNIFSMDLQSGEVTQHTDRQGSVSIVDMNRTRDHVLFTFEDVQTPRDLYAASFENLDDPVRLTDLNPFVRDSLILADYEVVQWESYDGLEIEGLKYTPVDIQQDGSAPFLLHIHGGPAGVFRNSFSPQYHVWAGLGYVQLAPNVRGSTAYGDELLRGNIEDIGDGDYEDLMSGVDMLIDQNWIDEEQMAVRGWSYGGILGGTTITKTDRFKAASLGAGVFDWTSEYAMGFNHDVRLWYIGGEPWTNPEGYRERSAATHAANVNTPTLFLHGDRDRVDTPQQSLIFFTFLKDIGKVDTRYIEFKREGHGIREPRNQRVRDVEEIRWIQKYARGMEWEPWERELNKEDENSEED